MLPSLEQIKKLIGRLGKGQQRLADILEFTQRELGKCVRDFNPGKVVEQARKQLAALHEQEPG